jgi:predicted dienelactone hydrolase
MTNRILKAISLGALTVVCGGSLVAGPLKPLVPPVRVLQADAKGDEVKIGALDVSVWTPSQTPAPVIIFSHGFHGSTTQSKFLMKALANAGYIVFAPNHQDSNKLNEHAMPEDRFAQPNLWTDADYTDRRDDIVNLISSLKSDPNWSSKIDFSRMGLAGHSLGGYTVMGLAGGWPSWKLPGVKAVLALSPYIQPFIWKKTLGGIESPVMYQGGTMDFGISPSVKRLGGAFDETPSPAYLVDLEGAGHLAWTDITRRFQDSISRYSVAFFDKYVKGDATADVKTKLNDVADLRSK